MCQGNHGSGPVWLAATCHGQDRLHNLWGPVQNEIAGRILVQKVSRVSRQWQQDIKLRAGLFQAHSNVRQYGSHALEASSDIGTNPG